MAKVVFARRQAPDWQLIAGRYRQGLPIDPGLFVPKETIPGFPPAIERLIANWNRSFSVDFFSFRAAVAALSEANIAAIPDSLALDYDDPRLLEEVAQNRDAYVYFHDDDDFFSPEIVRILGEQENGGDVIVSPLFRLGFGTYTFVNPGVGSDYLWGQPEAFRMTFQSNNYGLKAAFFDDPGELLRFKDHAHASRLAADLLPHIVHISAPISATVKTPASASVLPRVVGPRKTLVRRLGLSSFRMEYFRGFVADTDPTGVPPAYGWIARPMEEIRALVQAILDRRPVS